MGSLLYRQQGQQLQRLAQTHVIRQHRADVVAGHPIQPVDAPALVLAQLGMDRIGDLHAVGRSTIQPAKQRGVPLGASEGNGVLRHRLQGHLAQVRQRDRFFLFTLVEFLAAAFHLGHKFFPAGLFQLAGHLGGRGELLELL